MGHLGLFLQLKRSQVAIQSPPLRERTRLLGNVDEHVATSPFQSHRLEAVMFFGEALLLVEVSSKGQRTVVDIVSPLVVRASETPFHLSFWSVADLESPVSTDIVEGPHFAIPATNQNDRVGTELNRNVLAGLENLGIMSCKYPFFVPNGLEIDLIEIRIVVEASRKAMVREPGGKLSRPTRQGIACRRDTWCRWGRWGCGGECRGREHALRARSGLVS